MSHLITIIQRVRNRLKVSGGDPKKASKDPSFRDAVMNLKEFQEIWEGRATQEEVTVANDLYNKYKGYL